MNVVSLRKPMRASERRRVDDGPELRFTCLLPPHLAFVVATGEYVPNTHVDVDGLVTIKGRDRSWVLRTARDFIEHIAGGRDLELTGMLVCPAWPGPTPHDQPHAGTRSGYSISVKAGKASICRA